MKQPTPKKINNKTKKKELSIVTKKPKQKKQQHKQKYGTSKLEQDFARDFLDANNINYIYQYEAKEIKRFFDFAITSDKRKYITENKDGIECVKQDGQFFEVDFFIEVDGDYW